MTQNAYFKKYGLATLILVFIITSFAVLVPRTFGRTASDQPTLASARVADIQTIAIEVAENGTRFTPDEAPVFEEDGFPAYGAAFVTEGYIYPVGTLANSEHGGALEDGSPEFPDLVMGTWTCWGYHIADGGHTEPGTGPWVVTTQLFNFGDSFGNETITTIGYEFPDTDEHSRAIVGGTGAYSFIGGVQKQSFVDWNDSVGVQLAIEFQARDLRGYQLSLPAIVRD
ncbi:MAG: hypothetical protein AAF614_35165 [Chloroflexota bacterium]